MSTGMAVTCSLGYLLFVQSPTPCIKLGGIMSGEDRNWPPVFTTAWSRIAPQSKMFLGKDESE